MVLGLISVPVTIIWTLTCAVLLGAWTCLHLTIFAAARGCISTAAALFPWMVSALRSGCASLPQAALAAARVLRHDSGPALLAAAGALRSCVISIPRIAVRLAADGTRRVVAAARKLLLAMLFATISAWCDSQRRLWRERQAARQQVQQDVRAQRGVAASGSGTLRAGGLSGVTSGKKPSAQPSKAAPGGGKRACKDARKASKSSATFVAPSTDATPLVYADGSQPTATADLVELLPQTFADTTSSAGKLYKVTLQMLRFRRMIFNINVPATSILMMPQFLS